MIPRDSLKVLRHGMVRAACLSVLVALSALAQVSFQDPFLNNGQKRLTSNLRQARLDLRWNRDPCWAAAQV